MPEVHTRWAEERGGVLMDWKREAAEMLRNYPAMQMSLITLPQELERLESEATALGSSLGGSGRVAGGRGEPDDRIVSNMVKRELVKSNLEIARRHIEIVENGLSVLDDDERLILDLMFIHKARGNVDRLCSELDIENPPGVYKRKDKALRHFTIALYGITES